MWCARRLAYRLLLVQSIKDVPVELRRLRRSLGTCRKSMTMITTTTQEAIPDVENNRKKKLCKVERTPEWLSEMASIYNIFRRKLCSPKCRSIKRHHEKENKSSTIPSVISPLRSFEFSNSSHSNTQFVGCFFFRSFSFSFFLVPQTHCVRS